MEILRLKQACFRIKLSSKIIYTDPFQIPKTEEHKSQADIILISHPHYDHYDIPSIKHIMRDNTLIISPRSGKKIHKMFKNTKVLLPGEFHLHESIKITAFPAYNINKFFHRKKKNWVGYLITDGNMNLYHAGDTDLIPEMEKLGTMEIDYAFIPISGKFVMDINEAVKAVGIIQPQNVIPMHELNSSSETFENSVRINLKNPKINIIKLKNGETFAI